MNVAAPSSPKIPPGIFKQSLEEYSRATFGPNKSGFQKGFVNTFSTLPFGVAETVLAGGVINGLGFSLQEGLTQLVPKVGSGVLVRQSWLIGIDELIVEILQYLHYSFYPPIAGAGFSKLIAPMFDIPHFELMGQRMHDLRKNIGQELEVGTLRKKKILITPGLVNKIGVAKLLLFGLMAGTFMAGEVMLPSIKVLLMKKIFHTSDFYTISGLQSQRDEVEGSGQAAIDTAKNNIKNAILYILTSVPFFLGLSKLLSLKKNWGNNRFINGAANVFQLGSKFDLSKALIACGVLTAGLYGYPSVARNDAETSEVRNRILRFTVPTVLFFKQFVGDLLTWVTGRALGFKNFMSSPVEWWNEVKIGRREFLELDFVGLDIDRARKHSSDPYIGRLTELPQFQKLKQENPQKYLNTLKTLHFMNHRAPYLMALFTGIGVGILNFLNTMSMHKKEKASQDHSQRAGFAHA